VIFYDLLLTEGHYISDFIFIQYGSEFGARSR